MPRRLGDAISIVFYNVHFHAIWFALPLNVAIVAGTEIAGVWRDDIKIVIHSPMCSGCVHIKLDVTTEQIESLLAVCTSTTCHGPTIAVPMASRDCEIILRRAIQLRCSNSSKGHEACRFHLCRK